MFTRYKASQPRPYNFLEIPFLVNYFDDDEVENDVGKIFNSKYGMNIICSLN